MNPKTLKHLKTTLKVHAKALSIPSGSAEIFIEKSLTATAKALEKRKVITDADLTRVLTRELKKYHPDLAYVYKNYAKII